MNVCLPRVHLRRLTFEAEAIARLLDDLTLLIEPGCGVAFGQKRKSAD
jgi:hypothetical protein